ncbi:hypothetical protein M3Y98_00676600 [Aphelenchoides besseyi]|nr:hypothetical protein M3Y98_00676600 [Aphelenchoides besseyi]KAI6209135.1 hypothetical protein M3Y96_00189000 [Aphelenchoides besseyi]
MEIASEQPQRITFKMLEEETKALKEAVELFRRFNDPDERGELTLHKICEESQVLQRQANLYNLINAYKESIRSDDTQTIEEAEWSFVLADLLIQCEKGLRQALFLLDGGLSNDVAESLKATSGNATEFRRWLKILRVLCKSEVECKNIWQQGALPSRVKRNLEQIYLSTEFDELVDIVKTEFSDLFEISTVEEEYEKYVYNFLEDCRILDYDVITHSFRVVYETIPEDFIFNSKFLDLLLEIENFLLELIPKLNEKQLKCVSIFYRVLVLIYQHYEERYKFIDAYVGRYNVYAFPAIKYRSDIVTMAYNDYLSELIDEMEWYSRHPDFTLDFDCTFQLLYALDPIHTSKSLLSFIHENCDCLSLRFKTLFLDCAKLFRRVKPQYQNGEALVRNACFSRSLAELTEELVSKNDPQLSKFYDVITELTVTKQIEGCRVRAITSVTDYLNALLILYESGNKFTNDFSNIKELLEKIFSHDDRTASEYFKIEYKQLNRRVLREFLSRNPPKDYWMQTHVYLLYERLTKNNIVWKSSELSEWKNFQLHSQEPAVAMPPPLSSVVQKEVLSEMNAADGLDESTSMSKFYKKSKADNGLTQSKRPKKTGSDVKEKHVEKKPLPKVVVNPTPDVSKLAPARGKIYQSTRGGKGKTFADFRENCFISY